MRNTSQHQSLLVSGVNKSEQNIVRDKFLLKLVYENNGYWQYYKNTNINPISHNIIKKVLRLIMSVCFTDEFNFILNNQFLQPNISLRKCQHFIFGSELSILEKSISGLGFVIIIFSVDLRLKETNLLVEKITRFM